jgi:hypothetical protein
MRTFKEDHIEHLQAELQDYKDYCKELIDLIERLGSYFDERSQWIQKGDKYLPANREAELLEQIDGVL